MSILTTYIFRKVFTLNLIVIVGVLVMMSFNRLLFVLKRAANGSIPNEIIGILTLNQLPEFIGSILPMTAILGVVAIYLKLVKSQQITIMHSIGISKGKLLLMFALPILPFIAASFICLSFVSPISLAKINAIIESTRTDPRYLLRSYQNYSDGRINIDFKGYSSNTLLKPFLLDYTDDSNSAVYAEKAKLIQTENAYKIQFQNGQFVSLQKTGELRTGNFKELSYQINLAPLSILRKIPDANTQSLDKILQKKQWSRQDFAVFLWLISPPICMLILLLFTIGQCRHTPRSHSNSLYFKVLVISLLYIQLLIVGRDKVDVNPLWYYLGIHISALAIALYSFYSTSLRISSQP